MMIESISSRIKSLPPLDTTIIQIQTVCNDENSSLNDLMKIVEKDPMLTTNILRSANSPLYGFSREVTDIKRAISLFGMATIKGFALASAIKKSFNINLSPYGISESTFAHISLIQNALMIDWYQKVDKESLSILAPASFIMEVGKIILANEAIEKNISQDFKAGLENVTTPSELSKYETEFFGMSNEEVAANIFEQWNLETELIEAIYNSNNPENAVSYISSYSKALNIVKNFVNIFYQGGEKAVETTNYLLQKYDLDEDKFFNSTHKVFE